MAGFIASKIVTLLVLPPGGPILIIFLGLCLLRRFRKVSAYLVALGLLLLYASSMPLVSKSIWPRSGDDDTVVSQADMDSAAAIVILGGGLYANAPEYGGDTIGGAALERVRYGAYLHRLSGKPLLVTGGRPKKTQLSEAEAMRNVLESEFGVAVKWLEERSLNTRDNADYSRIILAAEKIDNILLVTHASHMTRAREEFERAGFDVFPAPTKFRVKRPLSFFDFLPSASALASTARSLHEWLGRAWYAVSR
jgi:uncharacterized SAM-binding protein YcdF (DUF218 family)